jgi:hypothetical protein
VRKSLTQALLAMALAVGTVAGCAPNTPSPKDDAAPTPSAPSAESVPASPTPDEAPPTSPNVAPTPSKVTLPVQGAYRWDTSKPLVPGEITEFHLDIRSEIPVETLIVTINQIGDVELLSDRELKAGPLTTGETYTAPVKLRVTRPGRVELRAKVVGQNAEGAPVFGTSYPLYMLLINNRLLAGTNGYTPLEMAELERQKAAGELDDAAFEREKRRIHGGGARELITVTPASSGR